MFQCGLKFQSIPLRITYNSEHFESIEYINGLFSFLCTLQMNDPKINIDLDDFSSLLKLVMQNLLFNFRSQ
jgi:hypothetical protein